MKSTLPPAFTRCQSVELAAALSVLGAEVRLDISTDRITGKHWKTILIGTDSVDYKAIGARVIAKGQEEEAPEPTVSTKLIMNLILQRKLQELEPHHPALDVLRVCKAADAILDWIQKGHDYRLVKVQGADRWQLLPGQILPATKTGPCLFGTRDRKLAAVLCVLGYELARIEGSAPQCLFCFTGPHAGGLPQTCVDLAQAIRTRRMQETQPDHPALWMLQGLINRDAISDLLRTRQPLVLIRAPGTGRASLVSSNAKGRTLDHVKKHLGIQ